jgi:MraZ protein
MSMAERAQSALLRPFANVERGGPGRMSAFLGTHTNKLDAKGRVSIPAPYRAALRPTAEGAPLILRPSHKNPCIEGWPAAAFQALAAPLNELDMFGDDHDDLAAALYSGAHQSEPDKEGRIVLPADLIDCANLSDSVVFIGMGKIFHIWEPAAGAKFLAESKERARAARLTLPGAANGARA